MDKNVYRVYIFKNAILEGNQDLFFFLNLPRLTSLSCFWKAVLVTLMLTFLEQIFLASCLYNLLLSTTSFHCLQTCSFLVELLRTNFTKKLVLFRRKVYSNQLCSKKFFEVEMSKDQLKHIRVEASLRSE